MPINIDGTEISTATIDGTEVKEITADGDVVFTATPQVLVINFGNSFDVYELGTWNKLDDISASIYISSWDINTAGNYLATGGYGKIEIYNTSEWSVEQTITPYTKTVNDIDFSPNNQYLVHCENHWDGTFDKVYVVDTSNWSRVKTLTGGSPTQYVAIGNNYVAGASNEETYVWSLGNWNEQLSFSHTSDFSDGIAFDDTEDNFVFTQNQNPTRVYDTSTWTKTTEINDASQPSFSPSGDELVFVEASDVRVWDTTSTNPTNWTQTQYLNDGDVTYDACWADGGNYLAFTSRDNNTVYVYETTNWTLETSISVPSSPYAVQATI
jgi:WD40 repeat protein